MNTVFGVPRICIVSILYKSLGVQKKKPTYYCNHNKNQPAAILISKNNQTKTTTLPKNHSNKNCLNLLPYLKSVPN